MDGEAMRKVLVVSPHLDDAVLSVGQFLAGRPDAVVATVFTGIPDDPNMLTPYDKKCGFKSAKHAMTIRRAEDYNALDILSSTPEHLDFLDSQYGSNFGSQFADAVQKLADIAIEHDVEYILAPVGMVHPDHKWVRRVALKTSSTVGKPLWLYEELPARITHPEEIIPVYQELMDNGYSMSLDFLGDGPVSNKIGALGCYQSQMGLPEFKNERYLTMPERFWKIDKVDNA